MGRPSDDRLNHRNLFDIEPPKVLILVEWESTDAFDRLDDLRPLLKPQ